MKKLFLAAFALAALSSPFATPALAAGDLGVKAQKLPNLEIGMDDAGYAVSQKVYELETGKAYRLLVKASGKQACAWEAPKFFQNIWLRRITAGEVEISVPSVNSFDFDDPGEVELYFVPVRSGEFQWTCPGLEAKGVTGTFKVK